MVYRTIAVGAFVGGVTSLPLLALFYLGNRLAGLPFVPFDLFDWLARVLPGAWVTMGIDAIVGLIRQFGLGATDTAAKQIESVLALGLVVLSGILLGAVLAWAVRRRPQHGRQIGALAGLLLFLLVAAIELTFGLAGNPALALAWLALLYGSWGACLGLLLVRTVPAPVTAQPLPSRRA